MIWHSLLHAWYTVSGANNEAGPTYGSWSGVAGATSCFAWIPASFVLYRHLNCKRHRCWRIGHHATADGTKVCRHHHPDLRGRRITDELLGLLHKAAQ